MKTSTIAASLLANLISAQPFVPAASVDLLLSLESDGDAASILSIPFNTLSNQTAGRKAVAVAIRGGRNLPIQERDLLCQCFSDAAGTTLLGEAFNSTSPTSGTVISMTVPIQIGSILCSDAKTVGLAVSRAFPAIPPPPPPPATTTTVPPPVTTTAPVSPPPSSTIAPPAPTNVIPTVRIQINFSGEGAAQALIPVNNQVTPTRGLLSTSVGSDAFILSGQGVPWKKVSCQAFSSNGEETSPVGPPFVGMDPVVFAGGKDVPISGVLCKAV